MKKIVLSLIMFLFAFAMHAQDTKTAFDFSALNEIPLGANLANYNYIFQKGGKSYYFKGDVKKVQNLFIGAMESSGKNEDSDCPEPLPANCVCSNGYVIRRMMQ